MSGQTLYDDVMGQQRKGRLGAIEKDILEDLTAGDLFYGFLLSARSTSRMYKLARERAAARYRRKRAIGRLVGQGYVRECGSRLSITPLGKSAIGAVATSTRAQLKQTRWDGKWRIVTFDIPEKYAVLRRKVRSVLTRAGFVRLQQSLWVFPHDCRELAQLIQEDPRLTRHILYGVLDRIDNDERLRAAFKL